MKGFNKQTTPVTTPGIYHSPDLGLISLSSDGSDWITIADKNLGATQVYNSGDTLSEANAGKFYQWGNNYGFPFTGAVTTSSTKVYASTYGPGNYYSSSTFITANPRDSSSNTNLRGDTTNTDIARRGPCDEGYHIPSNNENGTLVSIITSLGIDTSNGNCMKTYLKMPFAGNLSYSTGSHGEGDISGYYVSSTRYNANYADYMYLYSLSMNAQNQTYLIFGFSIRPFKNDSVAPDNTWTVLYQP